MKKWNIYNSLMIAVLLPYLALVAHAHNTNEPLYRLLAHEDVFSLYVDIGKCLVAYLVGRWLR